MARLTNDDREYTVVLSDDIIEYGKEAGVIVTVDGIDYSHGAVVCRTSKRYTQTIRIPKETNYRDLEYKHKRRK